MSVDIIVELLLQQQRVLDELTKLDEARNKGLINDEEHKFFLQQTHGKSSTEEIIAE